MECRDQCREIRLVGLSFKDQPRNLVFAEVLDFLLFLRLDVRPVYEAYQVAERLVLVY